MINCSVIHIKISIKFTSMFVVVSEKLNSLLLAHVSNLAVWLWSGVHKTVSTINMKT